MSGLSPCRSRCAESNRPFIVARYLIWRFSINLQQPTLSVLLLVKSIHPQDVWTMAAPQCSSASGGWSQIYLPKVEVKNSIIELNNCTYLTWRPKLSEHGACHLPSLSATNIESHRLSPAQWTAPRTREPMRLGAAIGRAVVADKASRSLEVNLANSDDKLGRSWTFFAGCSCVACRAECE